MKRHVKIYFDYFGYDTTSWIPCEVCGTTAVDINHISARGMGGDPQGLKDTIENLMAVCRMCHIEFGDKEKHKEFLQNIHNKTMKQ